MMEEQAASSSFQLGGSCVRGRRKSTGIGDGSDLGHGRAADDGNFLEKQTYSTWPGLEPG